MDAPRAVNSIDGARTDSLFRRACESALSLAHAQARETSAVAYIWPPSPVTDTTSDRLSTNSSVSTRGHCNTRGAGGAGGPP